MVNYIGLIILLQTSPHSIVIAPLALLVIYYLNLTPDKPNILTESFGDREQDQFDFLSGKENIMIDDSG